MAKQRAKSRRQYVLQNDAAIIAAKLPGARIAKHPAFVPPALATLRDKVPSGAKWIHEIKFDGYRIQLHKQQNDIRAYSRRGHNWANRFNSLVSALWRLQVFDVVLDGEVIVPTETGHSDFGALVKDLGAGRSRSGRCLNGSKPQLAKPECSPSNRRASPPREGRRFALHRTFGMSVQAARRDQYG